MIKKSIAFVLCGLLAACATIETPPPTAAASLPSVSDIVPLDHNGRMGVWFEEVALGDVLAGIELEKGKERVKTEMEKMARELAEKQLREVVAAQQPVMQWLKYGLTTGLGALVLGAIGGFFAGQR